VRLFFLTYSPNGMGGFVRGDWPDGRPTLEQPELAIMVFRMITVAINEKQERDARDAG
jgi:hypothetical protein